MEITVDMDISRLALLPAGYLMQQRDPFSEFAQGHGVGSSYRGVFAVSAWAYQLHIYLDMIEKRYGADIADEVREQQCGFFGNMPAGGGEIDVALELIDRAASPGKLVIPLQYREIEIPAEMNISMALLLGLAQSPDFVAHPADRAAQITRMDPEVDWCLCECLMSRRQDIVSSCSIAMAQVAVYPNSFSPLPNSGTA